MKFSAIFWFLLSFICPDLIAQRLAPFESVTLHDPQFYSDRIPFEKTLSYFGMVPDSSQADTIIEGKPAFFHYCYLPADAGEFAVRFISPVPELFFADKGDIETEEYLSANSDQRNHWFDAGIMVQSMVGHASEKQFSDQVNLSNTHSKEVPPLPDGKFGNPLIRNTTGAFKAGFYRLIVLIESEDDHNFGSYLIQIGTVPRIRNIKVSRKFEDL